MRLPQKIFNAFQDLEKNVSLSTNKEYNQNLLWLIRDYLEDNTKIFQDKLQRRNIQIKELKKRLKGSKHPAHPEAIKQNTCY